MIHYIRNVNNETIVDINASASDLHAIVVVEGFSRHMLSLPDGNKGEFINDMGALQEIRGEYWEKQRHTETPEALAARRCKEIASKWGLVYVTD